MDSLGSRLKKMRQDEFTQTEVSKILQISNGTLSGYERGYRVPDVKTLIKLANLYNVTTDYLLTGYIVKQVNTAVVALPNNLIDEIFREKFGEITDLEREYLFCCLLLLRKITSKAEYQTSKDQI